MGGGPRGARGLGGGEEEGGGSGRCGVSVLDALGEVVPAGRERAALLDRDTCIYEVVRDLVEAGEGRLSRVAGRPREGREAGVSLVLSNAVRHLELVYCPRDTLPEWSQCSSSYAPDEEPEAVQMDSWSRGQLVTRVKDVGRVGDATAKARKLAAIYRSMTRGEGATWRPDSASAAQAITALDKAVHKALMDGEREYTKPRSGSRVALQRWQVELYEALGRGLTQYWHVFEDGTRERIVIGKRESRPPRPEEPTERGAGGTQGEEGAEGVLFQWRPGQGGSPTGKKDLRPVVDAWAEFDERREKHEFWHPTGPSPSAGLELSGAASLSTGMPSERVSLTTRARPPSSPRWTIRGVSPRSRRPQSAAARPAQDTRPGPSSAGARPRPQSAKHSPSPAASASASASASARRAVPDETHRPGTRPSTAKAISAALTAKAERGIEAYLEKKKRPASASPAFGGGRFR